MGRRTAAEVRSTSVAEDGLTVVVLMGFGWSHFLEEGGRQRQLGITVEGSRSPPRPALIRPPPLSRTTTQLVDILTASRNYRLLKAQHISETPAEVL